MKDVIDSMKKLEEDNHIDVTEANDFLDLFYAHRDILEPEIRLDVFSLLTDLLRDDSPQKHGAGLAMLQAFYDSVDKDDALAIEAIKWSDKFRDIEDKLFQPGEQDDDSSRIFGKEKLYKYLLNEYVYLTISGSGLSLEQRFVFFQDLLLHIGYKGHYFFPRGNAWYDLRGLELLEKHFRDGNDVFDFTRFNSIKPLVIYEIYNQSVSADFLVEIALTPHISDIVEFLDTLAPRDRKVLVGQSTIQLMNPSFCSGISRYIQSKNLTPPDKSESDYEDQWKEIIDGYQQLLNEYIRINEPYTHFLSLSLSYSDRVGPTIHHTTRFFESLMPEDCDTQHFVMCDLDNISEDGELPENPIEWHAFVETINSLANDSSNNVVVYIGLHGDNAGDSYNHIVDGSMLVKKEEFSGLWNIDASFFVDKCFAGATIDRSSSNFTANSIQLGSDRTYGTIFRKDHRIWKDFMGFEYKLSLDDKHNDDGGIISNFLKKSDILQSQDFSQFGNIAKALQSYFETHSLGDPDYDSTINKNKDYICNFFSDTTNYDIEKQFDADFDGDGKVSLHEARLYYMNQHPYNILPTFFTDDTGNKHRVS